METRGNQPFVRLNDGTPIPAVAVMNMDGSIEETAANLESIRPAPNGYPITPSNTTDLPTPTKAIYVGNAGDVAVDFVTSGTNVVIKNATAGSVLPFQVKRVYATGTSATNLVALF